MTDRSLEPAPRPSASGAGAVDDEVRVARAYLSRVAEPGSVALWALVCAVGPVGAADAVRRGAVDARLVSATAARRDSDPYADLEAAARLGMRLVVPESEEWPHHAFGTLERLAAQRVRAARSRRSRSGGESLQLPPELDGLHPAANAHEDPETDDPRRDPYGEPLPPLALWVRGDGDLASLGWRSVAIVGARAATDYGEHVAKDWAYGLARQDVTVVSGGAYGIDAAAHRGALAAAGQTVLVSAAGLDRPYPPGNASLYERVAESGLLISESPPGCAPHRHRFLSRNRLIAALSTGIVVVEAARRSGATNTAHHGSRLGRSVMAVPGPVTSAMSAGCHELVRNGDASLVASMADVVAVVGSMGEGFEPVQPVGDLRAELDQLDASARRVFDGLAARSWSTPQDIARRAGVSPLDVARALPALDTAGLIETSDAGYRIADRLRKQGRRAR